MPAPVRPLILGLLAALACAVPSAQARTCRVDKAEYAALRIGMSYARVRDALGCGGRQLGQIRIGRTRRTTYSWAAAGTYGANVTLTFRDGHLTDKAQLGLR